MTLDVIVPTYNRSPLLRLTVESLLRAPVPANLAVSIFVVDNNSPDDTAAVVRELQEHAVIPLHYILETQQGSSHARNAGITAGTAELLGFIDDDEEVEEHWYEVTAREFLDASVQYISGCCLPNWQAPIPDWLPPGYHSVIGASPPKERGWLGDGHPGMLIGGNSVIRRSVFDAVGLYSTRLGRSNKGLLSEEDAEFYRRVLQAGIRGLYVPDLAMYHYIPQSRLTRRYHRQWAYWRAVSQGVLDREGGESVAYTLGVPRYRIGRAVRGALGYPAHRLAAGKQGQAFADELAVWDLAGFVYGKHFAKVEQFYSGAR